jgi:hypothetical protein
MQARQATLDTLLFPERSRDSRRKACFVESAGGVVLSSSTWMDTRSVIRELIAEALEARKKRAR